MKQSGNTPLREPPALRYRVNSFPARNDALRGNETQFQSGLFNKHIQVFDAFATDSAFCGDNVVEQQWSCGAASAGPFHRPDITITASAHSLHADVLSPLEQSTPQSTTGRLTAIPIGGSVLPPGWNRGQQTGSRLAMGPSCPPDFSTRRPVTTCPLPSTAPLIRPVENAARLVRRRGQAQS